MSKNKKDKFKCYDCGEEYRHAEDLYDHIQEEHPDNIPPGFSPARYHYMRRTGKKTRLCMICKKETSWNEATKAYNPFCSEACRKKFRKIFEARMIKKYDKVCLLNDPDQQRKMAANRKISGEYRWSNNPSIAKSYMGSYERKALEYEDIVLKMDPNDIMCPSPHTYYYEYEGKSHFYIPDQYITSINAEIEIKDGGNNPNKHPDIVRVNKVKERLKDDVMKSMRQVNYLKLTDNNMSLLVKFINTIKEIAASDNPNRVVIMIADDMTIQDKKVATESLSYGDMLMIDNALEHLKYDDSNIEEITKTDDSNIGDFIKFLYNKGVV